MLRSLAIVCLLSCVCLANISPSEAGLVGHWTFDDADVNGDIVMDVSGNNRHGMKMNDGPITGVPGPPGFGQAAEFGGGFNNEDNHFVDLSDHAAAFADLSEGTLAAWVKPVTTDEAGCPDGHCTDVLTIFAASDSTQGSVEMRWVVHTRTSPFNPDGPGGGVPIGHGDNYLGVRGADFNDHLITDVAGIDGDGLSLLDGQWHHVAVTVDGDNQGTIYIDGAEVESRYAQNSDAISFMGDLLPDGPNTVGIGRNLDTTAPAAGHEIGGQWFYHGLIDDLRVYDTALSANEISALLNPAAGGQFSVDLVAYYSFDDGAGEVLKEGSGNGTDGELFNFDFTDDSNWTEGQVGGALEFDGIDDFVIAPEYELAEEALTVALWAFSDDNVTWASLVKNWAGPPGQFHFGLGPGDADTLNIFITGDDGAAVNVGQDLDDFPLEEWEHVAFVADPESETVTQYRNGEVVSEEEYVGAFTDAPINSALGIGVKPNAAGDGADGGVPAYWDGKLDDLGVWTRALSADEIKQIFENGLAGKSIVSSGGVILQAGDADQDLDFDQIDLVQVQIAAKYLTGDPATWGEGDWDGAPGGSPGDPPAGDGVFSQTDIIAALTGGFYLTGPYAAIRDGGVVGDGQTSISYNATTGEVAVDAPAGTELTSVNIDSAAGIFTGDAAANLGGSFDNDADGNIFKATFGSSFGSVSFGNVAQTGLTKEFVLSDLTVVGSLNGGGDLGNVDLIYVPEPGSLLLSVLGIVGLIGVSRRR